MRPAGLALACCVLALLAGCSGQTVKSGQEGGAQSPPEPRTKPVPARTAATPRPPREEHHGPDAEHAFALANQLLPTNLRDRRGWAQDIATGMTALGIPAEPHKVCAIAAVIEQESGWQADPVVPDLPRIARSEMDKKLGKYMIPSAVLDVALTMKSPSGQTYAQRIDKLRTERDLSQLYEEMIAEVPRGPELFGHMNPVRTGGPMQVSVSFAEGVLKERPYPWRNRGSARDEVFTRRGGVYFGTAMLLDYQVSYDRMLYRFADYNAGRYASRNAAFQRLVAALTKTDLAPDGDLLRYADGEASGTSQTERALWKIADLGLGKSAIRRDLLLEKRFDFERSELYRRVRALAAQHGLQTPDAALPAIALKSPKITRNLTTAWFAERVEGRYRRCMARGATAGGW